MKIKTDTSSYFKGFNITMSTYNGESHISFGIWEEINSSDPLKTNRIVNLEGKAKLMVLEQFKATDTFKNYQKKLLTFLN